MNTTQTTVCIHCDAPIGIPGTKLAPVGGKCDICIARLAWKMDDDMVTFVDFGDGPMVNAMYVDTRGDF